MDSDTPPLDQVARYRFAIQHGTPSFLTSVRDLPTDQLDAAIVNFCADEVARYRPQPTAPVRCSASASGRHSNAWWCEHCSEELGSPADRATQGLFMNKRPSD